MPADAFFFYAFAALTLAGALMTITLRSAVHCAIALIASLAGTAGLYLLQKAEFLFAVQIVLYIGGIMVLFLFVIMLVNLDSALRERQYHRRWWVSLLAVLSSGTLIIYFLIRGATGFPVTASTAPPGGNVERLADLLFSEYLLPFEAVSLLLLVAIVGSVIMARKRLTE